MKFELFHTQGSLPIVNIKSNPFKVFKWVHKLIQILLEPYVDLTFSGRTYHFCHISETTWYVASSKTCLLWGLKHAL